MDNFSGIRRHVFLVPVITWSIAPDGRFLLIKSPPNEEVHEYVRTMFPDGVPVIQNWASTLENTA